VARRRSSRRKIPVEIWVAVIGLIGVIIAAILSSPLLIELLKNTPSPTQTPSVILTRDRSPTPSFGDDSIACIVSQKGPGMPSQVAMSSLFYSSTALGRIQELPLAGGQKIPFDRMTSFEAVDISQETGGVIVEIAVRDGDRVTDLVDFSQYVNTKLIGSTEVGPFELLFLDVKRVDFKDQGDCS
jgi:hypothetical protein